MRRNSNVVMSMIAAQPPKPRAHVVNKFGMKTMSNQFRRFKATADGSAMSQIKKELGGLNM